jgi:hypothetical protein
MKNNRIVLPAHNTGVAPGVDAIDATSAAVPGATMTVRSDTAAAIATVGDVGDTAAAAGSPLAPPPSLTHITALPSSGLTVTSSANSDVMALIRGRADAVEVEAVAASPQPQQPQPQPQQPQQDLIIDARLRVVETFAFSFDSKLSTHRQGIDDSLRAAFAQMRGEFDNLVAKVASSSQTKAVDHSQEIATIRAHINTIAAAHGINVETPTIKMKQRRFLTHPATVEGGYVVLYYNPRNEENSEIQVRANQPRMVWTGYSFTIPDGYVADIWSAGRCVASFSGPTGDGDFRIPVLGTSDAGLAVSTGREVARLTLRRIEPVAVAVDRGGFGG